MKHFSLFGILQRSSFYTSNHSEIHFSIVSQCQIEFSLIIFRHPVKSDEVINLAERGGSTTLVHTHFHSVSFITSLNMTRLLHCVFLSTDDGSCVSVRNRKRTTYVLFFFSIFQSLVFSDMILFVLGLKFFVFFVT